LRFLNMAFFYSFTIFSAAVLAVFAHGGFGGGFGRHGAGSGFFSNLTSEQRQAFFNITKNGNLTKSQIKSQLDNWAASIGGDTQIRYTNFTTQMQQKITEGQQRMEQKLANNTAALQVYQQIEAVQNNQDITRTQECDQVRSILNSTTDDIRRELHWVAKFSCKRHGGNNGRGSFGQGFRGGNFGSSQEGGNFGGGFGGQRGGYGGKHQGNGGFGGNGGYGGSQGNGGFGGSQGNGGFGGSQGNGGFGGSQGNGGFGGSQGNGGFGGSQGNGGFGGSQGNGGFGGSQGNGGFGGSQGNGGFGGSQGNGGFGGSQGNGGFGGRQGNGGFGGRQGNGGFGGNQGNGQSGNSGFGGNRNGQSNGPNSGEDF